MCTRCGDYLQDTELAWILQGDTSTDCYLGEGYLEVLREPEATFGLIILNWANDCTYEAEAFATLDEVRDSIEEVVSHGNSPQFLFNLKEKRVIPFSYTKKIEVQIDNKETK